MSRAAAAREIIAVANAMDAAGFAPSKSGNVSVRTDRGFLITPTGKPYASLAPRDLVELDLGGNVIAGKLRPSSEWRFHACLYEAKPQCNAVVHNHSPRATALSCARKGIPPFHYMIAITGGMDIPCARYATFGTSELADNLLAAIGDRHAVLLANHGVVACGASLAKAWTIAQEVENLAGAYLDILAAGLKPAILSQAEMRRVLEKFQDYGQK
ncbi:MAG: class II aldolase/adducin family protein [Hyphomicrobiales bacterium]|nr:class II aldolase/adducin family protein [Hyphomicrobiales bacterium]